MVKDDGDGDGEEKRRQKMRPADGDSIEPGGLRSAPRVRMVAPGGWQRREARMA